MRIQTKNTITISCFLVLIFAQTSISQNVGVGTIYPTHSLHISNNSSEKTLRLTGPDGIYEHGARINFGDDNYVYLAEDGDDSLTIFANGRMALLGGNVGIGTVSPSTKLEIEGQVKITGGGPGDGKVLTSDANGLASWAESSTQATYAIGDFVQGGIVFWVSANAEHGKVVYIYDVVDAEWSNMNLQEIGNMANSLLNGAGNTVAVTQQSGHIQSAASHCADLAYGGYDDWYLPSKSELNAIYTHRVSINTTAMANGGEVFMDASYWASTETNAVSAVAKNLVTGGNFNDSKDLKRRIRAIRAF
ncbi:MAG: hypothetical protein DRI69_06530 [Bacteroidetes bacterium]|nr:MAG: hypothetical protein DRI69_06530 [Bacteroidota bacterium]